MRKFVAVILTLVCVAAATPAAADHTGDGPIPLNLGHRWPCAPLAIYVQPDAPDTVHAAVAEWHRVFRPDWTFTSDPGAPVRVLMRPPNDDGTGLGVAIFYGDETRLFQVEVRIHPDEVTSDEHAGQVARHEMGHVGHLGHTDSQWSAMGPNPLVYRYDVRSLIGMAFARRRCWS